MNPQSLERYILSTKSGVFKLLVSEQEDGRYVATLIHWTLTEKRLLKVPGDSGTMNFEGEKRFGISEGEVVGALMDWAKEKFGEVGVLSPDEENT